MAKRFEILGDDEIVRAMKEVEEYGCEEARKPMLRALYALLANSGLRVSEAVAYTSGTRIYPHALRWRNFDFERGEVTVTTLKQVKTKGRKSETYEDTIPLDADTMQALLAWREGSPLRGPNDPVFPISRRVAYNIWQKILHLACIRPMKLHSLRHAFVTRIIEQTGDLPLAQALARHRSISSTAVYVHCRNLKEKHAKLTPIRLGGNHV